METEGFAAGFRVTDVTRTTKTAGPHSEETRIRSPVESACASMHQNQPEETSQHADSARRNEYVHNISIYRLLLLNDAPNPSWTKCQIHDETK